MDEETRDPPVGTAGTTKRMGHHPLARRHPGKPFIPVLDALKDNPATPYLSAAILVFLSLFYLKERADPLLLLIAALSCVSVISLGPKNKIVLASLFCLSFLGASVLLAVSDDDYGYAGALALAFFSAMAVASAIGYLAGGEAGR